MNKIKREGVCLSCQGMGGHFSPDGGNGLGNSIMLRSLGLVVREILFQLPVLQVASGVTLSFT